MVNSVVSFQDIVELCLQNSVDFEVWHGKTTHKELSIRRQMLINPVNKPSIFVTFGDVKHGEQVSHISVSGNKMLEVSREELVATVSTQSNPRVWSSDELGSEVNAETAFTVLNKNSRVVLVSGVVNSFEGTDENGLNVYNFTLETPYSIPKGEVFVSKAPLIVKSESVLSVSDNFVGEGVYCYPSCVVI